MFKHVTKAQLVKHQDNVGLSSQPVAKKFVTPTMHVMLLFLQQLVFTKPNRMNAVHKRSLMLYLLQM